MQKHAFGYYTIYYHRRKPVAVFSCAGRRDPPAHMNIMNIKTVAPSVLLDFFSELLPAMVFQSNFSPKTGIKFGI